MDQLSEVLERALALGKGRHPDAPPAHHAAFANSVAYAVTGWSGGYGGPSMREHACSRVLVDQARKAAGEIGFDRAVEICEPVCYGPLTIFIARMLPLEHCFDDAPGETEEAMRILNN